MNYLNEVIRTIEQKLPTAFTLLEQSGGKSYTIAIKGDGLRTSESLFVFGDVNWFAARRHNIKGNRIASSMAGDPDEEVDKIVKWLLDSYKERK